MKILQKLSKKIIAKIFIVTGILVITIYGLVAIYSLVFEQEKLAIDKYNFEQLDRVKLILNDTKEDKQFLNLKEFNEMYNIGIKPIENCYYLRSYKGKERVKYGFSFKLESVILRLLYVTDYYTYPKYDIPVSTVCTMGGGCIDVARFNFIETISNPCKD